MNDEQIVPEKKPRGVKGPGFVPDMIHEGEDALFHVDHRYKEWFLEYASYVILDRAIPSLDDGLKPVQRRILHAMNELEDGRYNKAANIIGQAMRYHPHGDAAIGEALVKLAQKNLLIDTQGNWGNPLTGDDAAASRYIEARVSKFGLEILFQEGTTPWQASYDGRNKEPISLPVKFPILLYHGVEGIAVGLATKVLPHNFAELIQESISVLRGRTPHLYPDFPGGGVGDFTDYQDGKKGGKVRVRAVIEVDGTKTLRIKEVPYGVTTASLIESIISAHEKGNIKIKNVEDNTAENVDILVHLPQGVDCDRTISALYAFTECEVSISPACCVIDQEKPKFLTVGEILKHSTLRTKDLLKQELEIEREKIREKLHFAKLEKIFIEKRLYQQMESIDNWEEILATLFESLKAYKKQILRELTPEDVVKLTEIKIKRISKFDSKQADEQRKKLEEQLAEVENNLEYLTEYAVKFFKDLLKRYGKGKERRTKIDTFTQIKAKAIITADQKLYCNREEGFIGTGLKKDEFVFDCSKLDEIIVFRKDGNFMVTTVNEKTFVGKAILHLAIFKRNDERRIYHMLYRDGKDGEVMAKRFNVTSITRDREYPLTKGTEGSEVLYFSDNPNGESETVKIFLKDRPGMRKKDLDFDFAALTVKARTVQGVIASKHPVAKVEQALKGASTLAARRLWFDRETLQLNIQEKGLYLGKFEGDEKLIALFASGSLEVFPCTETEHPLKEDLIEILKLDPKSTLTVVYYDGEREENYIKRVTMEDMADGRFDFINRVSGSKVWLATFKDKPQAIFEYETKRGQVPLIETIALDDLVEARSIKALGNKLSKTNIARVRLV